MRPGSDMSRQNDLVIVAQLPQRPPLLVVQARQADHCRIVWKTTRMHAESDHPLHFGKRQVAVPKRKKRERNHFAGIGPAPLLAMTTIIGRDHREPEASFMPLTKPDAGKPRKRGGI